MDAKYIARVVNAQNTFQSGNAPQTRKACNQTHQQRTAYAHVTTGWRDTDQTGDSTRTGTQQRRFTANGPLAKHPGEDGTRRCDNGVHEGQRGDFVSGTCRACVEAKPAKVENRRTGKHHRQVVRLERFFPEAHTFANQVGTHQARDCGVDVYNGAARKVQRTMARQQTAAPYHMRDRHIGERQPDHHEDQDGRETNTLSKRTHNQPDGDAGKRSLESNVDVLIEAAHQRGQLDIFQHHPVEVTKERIARAERQRVSVNYPQHADQRERYRNLRQHGEHVLAADQAAVEQRNARN